MGLREEYNMRRYFALCILLTFFFCLFGCSFANKIFYPAGKPSGSYLEDQKKSHDELQVYIGKTKEQIYEEFGNPQRKRENIPVLLTPGCRKPDCKYDIAEEVWIYEDWGLLPFLALSGPDGAMFYFAGGKVKYTKP